MEPLTHLSPEGDARMVDVGAKPITARTATASGRVRMQPATAARIREGALPKGDVLAAARIAGIMAAKHTASLIPLCHPLPLDGVEVTLTVSEAAVNIRAVVRCTARTGVEMEALTAVTIAALTVYDMTKSMDKSMVIEAVQLDEKSGGRSGHYQRDGEIQTHE
jgi:cyclic pyranopterin phosphate synthase